VDAAGEAMTNAARHSGAASVSADRHGIRESIVGRMERGGGVATITSEPAEGTEVHLRLPRPSS
jgi:signal transduction histidine kinase